MSDPTPESVEEILDPTLPIVDAHHHLWDYPGRRYLFPEYIEDVQTGHRIVATVHVEGVSMYTQRAPEHLKPVGETEFARGAAAMSASGDYGEAEVCAAIVGFVDLTWGGRVQEALDAHLEAAGGRFRGIRDGGTWDADESIRRGIWRPDGGRYLHPAFREGFAKLAPNGLTFDAWLYHPQLDDLVDLARAFPETTIVLDHVGGPMGVGRYAEDRQATFAAWRTSIGRLAELGNVVVKLGGLGMWTGGLGLERADSPSSDRIATLYRPFIETCIEAFGADRCMFESNFPPDRLACDYAVLWNAFKKLAQGASDAERRDLFLGTARRVYRLELPDVG